MQNKNSVLSERSTHWCAVYYKYYYEESLFCIFRSEQVHSQEHISTIQHQSPQYALSPQKTQHTPVANNGGNQEKMLSVSGKKKCSHCGEELGNGASTRVLFDVFITLELMLRS